MAAKTKYHAGDIIRLQLSPDGRTTRWYYSEGQGDWVDNGYGGPWADGLILATTYEPANYSAWPPEPMAIVHFDNSDEKTMEWRMPLEESPYFPSKELPGWPKPPKTDVPKCDCGADAVYGIANMCHEHYCSKGIVLRAIGFIK